MKWFAKLLVMVLVVWLAAVPVMGTQAAPDDEVYNIAVLQAGWYGYWNEWDFYELTVEPGIENYNWTKIPITALTETGLAPYDVLIFPAEHGYGAWLTQSRKDAIVAWVNGGKLLIEHNYYYGQSSSNLLMAAFGEGYQVDWTGQVPSQRVYIFDAGNPLVSNPNILSSDNLSFWSPGVHNSISKATAGSAWNWAAYTTDGNWWLGYAFYGSGAIVICAGDPGSNTHYQYMYIATHWLIENEITLELPVNDVEVGIDIKPGSSPNSINPDSEGIIPVAILTTDAFDATTVNATTVTFGPGAATMVHKKAHLEDVDDDGDTDMLLHFKIQDSGIEAGDTEAELTGLTFDNQEIHGIDPVTTVGKENG